MSHVLLLDKFSGGVKYKTKKEMPIRSRLVLFSAQLFQGRRELPKLPTILNFWREKVVRPDQVYIGYALELEKKYL